MKIITDCAADLTTEDRKLYGPTEAPLYIGFPEGAINAVDITADEFYQRLKAMAPHAPPTSPATVDDMVALYRPAVESGESIISVHLSSGLSKTFEAAQEAKAQFPGADITLIDTKSVSGGLRFQVLAAAMASQAGWSKEAILDRIDRIRQKSEVAFTVETLEYLARGGRIGRLQAMAGSILNIKPVIRMDVSDGELSDIGKARSLWGAMTKMVDFFTQQYGTHMAMWAYVLHGDAEDKAEAMAEILTSRMNIAKLDQGRISPVLGVHAGPGIVGVTMVPMALMEGF